jgi:hypothetical protein
MIICTGALLALSATTDAFGWGAVTGPRGGAASTYPSCYYPPYYCYPPPYYPPPAW